MCERATDKHHDGDGITQLLQTGRGEIKDEEMTNKKKEQEKNSCKKTQSKQVKKSRDDGTWRTMTATREASALT